MKNKLKELSSLILRKGKHFNDQELIDASVDLFSLADSVPSSETTTNEEDDDTGGGGNHPGKPGNP